MGNNELDKDMIDLFELWRVYKMCKLSENIRRRAEVNKMLDKFKLKYRDIYSKHINQRRFL